MPRYDFSCANGHVQENVWAKYREWPPCPTCGGPTEILWQSSFPTVIDDSCDFTVEHMASEPIRFTSKQEHRRMCKQLGLRVKDRHIDGSALTKRWY